MKKAKKNRRTTSSKSRRNKILLASAIGFIIPLSIIYLMIGNYYKSHFFNNTIINGVPTSHMDALVAEEAINEKVKSYSLTIQGRNGVTDIIEGKDINLHTVFDESIENLLEKQKAYRWPSSILKEKEIEVKAMLQYDETLLKEKFNDLKFMKKENLIEPENATISEYDEMNGYTIISENPGAKVKEDILYDEIVNAIMELQPTLLIEDIDGYEQPKITSSNEKLLEALEEMNRIAGAKITYEFGEDIEILDGSKISEWISVNEDFTVHLDTDGVREYVDYIGKNYNSFGRTREFKTSYGDVITVKGGDYGWWLNRPEETKELTELIQNGEKLTKEPVYYQTAQQYGKDDIGDTYVEVNITAQHLFFYKDGKLIVETDFVSGNLAKDYGTPSGTYPIQYKENDATLVGEDYATPVKYWMPFNGNIGFHDANWRKEFGKDIYLTSGSHGCINMPPKAAQKMFEHIQRGVAVVVYELPGTENYEVKEDKVDEKNQSEKDNSKKEEKVEAVNTVDTEN